MHTLRDVQRLFHEALNDRPHGDLHRRIRDGGLAPARRIGVYRNNMRESLTGSLRATYPAVHALVGDDYFRMLAREYIKTHPSSSGDLHRFGDRFAEFTASIDGVEALPYLADTARLEWSVHQVFHAAEAPAIEPSALAGVDPGDYPQIVFEIHPASAMVSSRYPLAAIWELAIHGDARSDPVSLDSGPDRLLVARRGFEIEFQSMSEGEFTFMSEMLAGHTLERCGERASFTDPSFDPGLCLTRQFARGNLVGFTLRRPPAATAAATRPDQDRIVESR